jgi:hypothetical protein
MVRYTAPPFRAFARYEIARDFVDSRRLSRAGRIGAPRALAGTQQPFNGFPRGQATARAMMLHFDRGGGMGKR